MPLTWVRRDISALRCTVCKCHPIVSDRAADDGRTVTFKCPYGHISASGKDETLARREWSKAVRGQRVKQTSKVHAGVRDTTS